MPQPLTTSMPDLKRELMRHLQVKPTAEAREMEVFRFHVLDTYRIKCYRPLSHCFLPPGWQMTDPVTSRCWPMFIADSFFAASVDAFIGLGVRGRKVLAGFDGRPISQYQTDQVTKFTIVLRRGFFTS